MNNRILNKNTLKFFQPANDITCDSPVYANLGNLSVLPVEMINEIINNMTLETAYELYSSNSVLQRIMNNLSPLNAWLIKYQQILKAIDALQGDLNEISSSKPGFFQMLSLSFTDEMNRCQDEWWNAVEEDEEDRYTWGGKPDYNVAYAFSAIILVIGVFILLPGLLSVTGVVAIVAITAAIIAFAALPSAASRIFKVINMFDDQDAHDKYKRSDLENKKSTLMHSFFHLKTTPVKSLTNKVMDQPSASPRQQ